jgi:hypothetical protein
LFKSITKVYRTSNLETFMPSPVSISGLYKKYLAFVAA